MGFILFILGQSAVVAAVTQYFKRWEIIEKHPKLAAAVLNLLLVLVQGYLVNTMPKNIYDLVIVYLSSFLSAIGTYEVAKAAVNSVRSGG